MQRLAHLSAKTRAVLETPLLAQSVRSIYSTTPLRSQNNQEIPTSNNKEAPKTPKQSTPAPNEQRETTKSMAQEDEELRRRLEEMSGEGGAAGIEYEDGKPQAMKRSVRNNMFRYI